MLILSKHLRSNYLRVFAPLCELLAQNPVGFFKCAQAWSYLHVAQLRRNCGSGLSARIGWGFKADSAFTLGTAFAARAGYIQSIQPDFALIEET